MLLLLSLCVSVDYASNDTINNINKSEMKESNCTLVNGTYYDNRILDQTQSKIKSFGKIHKVYPTISMYAKPSCRCGKYYKYTWHYREFINYCPHCHNYGTLVKNPKGVPEREYTCSMKRGGCDSDFCGNCGKTKYSWSNVYLRRA